MPLVKVLLRIRLRALRKLGLIRSFSLIPSSEKTLVEIDKKWKQVWLKLSDDKSLGTRLASKDDKDKDFYCVSMFPYPSGMLHMGHARVYTISDIMTRFKRLRGYNVIHPMGWDAFGLPAENAAIERGINPAVWTLDNIEKMKAQMRMILADFDWEREVTTCSPEYYKWTQKIFLLLLQHGLVYRKKAEINWDPVDETVLANEQVDSNGKSWRSGALVEKRELEQWFIRITEYANLLNDDLKVLDKWPHKVKSMQEHWIGQSFGANIRFLTDDSDYPEIEIYTTRPDTLFSTQFIALAPSHPLTQKYAETDSSLKQFLQDISNYKPDSKAGYLLKDVRASVPISVDNKRNTNYDVRVYVAPYVIGNYGHGAVMGCPGHDERDFDFWKLHNPDVPIIQVIGKKDLRDEQLIPYTVKDGIMYDNSALKNGLPFLGSYAGKDIKKASREIVKNLELFNLGEESLQFRIRDWLISRQRYWGAPIPIIHCDHCGTVPVPDEQLPVTLPILENEVFGKGSPLGKIKSFVNTECPSCGNPAKRDTDTMDTFMDSSWYFFRYTDPKNNEAPFSYEKASRYMPIDMYIGGVEHAILHLLYSRFISKFMSDIGLWDGKSCKGEPIKELVTQGMVQAKTYKDPDTGKFLKRNEVEFIDGKPKIVGRSTSPLVSYEKMSKSKHNGADLTECIEKFGADSTRAYLMFLAPIKDALNWNEEQILGIQRWLKKVLNLKEAICELKQNQQPHDSTVETREYRNFKLRTKTLDNISLTEKEVAFYRQVQIYVSSISKSIEEDMSFNTVISDFMKLTNHIHSAVKSKVRVNPSLLLDAYEKLLVVMSPVTPCVTEECWEYLLNSVEKPWKSISLERFPEAHILESKDTLFKIFINGKYRQLFTESKSFIEKTDEDIVNLILKFDQVKKFVPEGRINKLIVKPSMISLVVPSKK